VNFCAEGHILDDTKCAADWISGLSPYGYSVLLMQYVIYFPRITAHDLFLKINLLID